uniref:Uncharacterized protein n=1 Tax=Nelumbo nucifera TaxID=4432 RepID=A0A822YW73_NELNU|nr:TPA_asm: hypothetical protein HUJ06_008975 [Nelumbo nucifera]
MRTNLGHYVTLIVTLCLPKKEEKSDDAIHITRVKVLRPTNTLVLGQAYRLITSEEVMKGLWAKRYANMKKSQTESVQRQPRTTNSNLHGLGSEIRERKSDLQNISQTARHERHRPRTGTAFTPSTSTSASAKSRPWRPSLQSITEASS